jgi:hypothetical protein
MGREKMDWRRFRRELRRWLVARIQHHQEFLTAVAANHVVGVDRGAQPAGNFAKNVVAGGVTEGVFDGLEMVDVAHHDSGTVSFAARPVNFAQE